MAWLMTASALVFLMQAGFALLESGYSRAKNCINVVMKNYFDLCVSSLVFWALGFGLMFGVNTSGWFGTSHFLPASGEGWDLGFLLFQTLFAATAATIASGAMAERTRFSAYLLASALITAVIYPVFGSWAWGGVNGGEGWLAQLGFIDFAGSTVVHGVGGWVALAGILILGPRLGRHGPAGELRELPGHNLNLVALGGFILWFGWFGFNGGSAMAASEAVGQINLNTHLAAAAGAAGAVAWAALFGRPILVGTVVNGSLGGLVGITAGCASVSPLAAVVIGAGAAIAAGAGERWLLRAGLDDVVGAVSVHAFAGAFGTLATGFLQEGNLFDSRQLLIQAVGVGSCFIWAFGGSLVMFKLIDLTLGLRAPPLHEQRGLDYSEHAEVAYPEFMQQSFYTKANLSEVERAT